MGELFQGVAFSLLYEPLEMGIAKNEDVWLFCKTMGNRELRNMDLSQVL